MKKTKIFVITGSRAEYGLLKPLIIRLDKEKRFDMKLIVTGMHLKNFFGNTIEEIINDGMKIYKKIDILSEKNDNLYESKALAKGIKKFSKFFIKDRPQLVVLLGDRYEIFSCAISAYLLNIPIAHIHGGEVTSGAFDEGIRHSITKMSTFHFTSTEKYKRRVIQLGENPETVFNVGGLFLDSIDMEKLSSFQEIKNKTKIKFQKKNILVTYHPLTLERFSNDQSFVNLLKVLNKHTDINVIFTSPNADPGNNEILDLIYSFVKKNPKRSVLFRSLGHQLYISLLQFVDAIVGNSSSGITEAPAFKIGTINIGDRQNGRIMPDSIINCQGNFSSINLAFEKLYSLEFKNKLKDIHNPYGNGDAASNIIKILKQISFLKSSQKFFYDIDTND